MNKFQLNALRLNAWGGGAVASAPAFEKIEVSGLSYILLENAAENGIISLTLNGKCSQSGTPTPTAPKMLQTNRGELRFGVLGNNLLEVVDSNIIVGKYINNNGVVTESLPNCYFQRFVSVKASTAYTLSTSRSLNYVNFMEYDENGAFLKRTLYGSSSAPAGTSVTHTMGTTTAFVIVGSNVDSAAFPSIAKDDVKSIKWMLNEGATALPYEPYKVGYVYGADDKVVLNYDNTDLPNPANADLLLSLGDVVDQQEIISGNITRRVGVKVFDGSEESWYLSMSGDVYRYRLRFEDEDNIAYKSGRNTNMLCTHFKVLASGSTANGCFLNGSSNVQYLFLIPPQTITDLETFRQWLQMQYAKGTPVMMIYQLDKETTEKVTPQPMSNPLGDVAVTRQLDVMMTCVYKKAIIDVPKGFATLQDAEGYNLQGADGSIVLVKSEGDEGSENNIIKFTFNGEEYTAEDGMTWYDWCQSAYNKDGWTCDSPSDLVYTWKNYIDPWNYEYFMVMYNGITVLGSDAIIPNGNYEECEDSMHIGGGGF